MASTPEIEFKNEYVDAHASIVNGVPVVEEQSPLFGIEPQRQTAGYWTNNAGHRAALAGEEGTRTLVLEFKGGLDPVVIPLAEDQFARYADETLEDGTLPILPGFEARIRDEGAKKEVTLKRKLKEADFDREGLTVRQELQWRVGDDVVHEHLYSDQKTVAATVSKWRFTKPVTITVNGQEEVRNEEIDLFVTPAGHKSVEVELPSENAVVADRPYVGKPLGKGWGVADLAFNGLPGSTPEAPGADLGGR